MAHRDIDCQTTAEELRRSRVELLVRSKIAEVFLLYSGDEVYSRSLKVVLDVLDSEIGYFGHVNEDGDIVSASMNVDVMDRCQVADKSVVFRRDSWAGLWGRSLIEKCSLYANQDLNPPPGHIPLHCALVTPILLRDELLGQLAVANKPGGYTDDDLQHLETIASHIAPILEARLRREWAEQREREMERSMQRLQHLESLAVLAGGVAHDFNNLLLGVIGNADLAVTELPEAAPAQEQLRAILSSAERAAELSQLMLAYSGNGKIVLEPVNLSHLVDDMLPLLSSGKAHRCRIHTELATGLPPLEADPRQLRQVVMNLVENAVEACAEGSEECAGNILVRTRLVRCERAELQRTYVDDGLPAGDYLCLEVSDDGSGIDEHTAARAFEPFFSSKFPGRGLGLAAVLGIVRGHHGAVCLAGGLGRGTTATVLLPVCEHPERLRVQSPVTSREPVNAEPTVTAPAAPGGNGGSCDRRRSWPAGGTVLVVEDDPGVCNMVVRMLQRFGMNTLVARDGCEGLQCFRSHCREIDLVLLDLTMPGMNGAELLAELRATRAEVPVLLTSGFNEDEVLAHLGKHLPDAIIRKPYRLPVLRRHLATILGDRPGARHGAASDS